MKREIPVQAWVILALMPLFFSSNMIIGRAAVSAVEPWTLAFWRWVIASLILLPAAWPGLVRHHRELRAAWPIIMLLGFLGMWICGGIVYVALKETSATNGTLIYTSSPVLIIALEAAFRRQRTSLRQIAGISIAFIGVATILFRGDIGRLWALQFNAGDIGIFCAVIAWAIYSVILRRQELARLPTIVLFTATAFAGTLTLLPFVLWELIVLEHFPTAPAAWTSIAGLALVSSVLAFSTYQYGVKKVGPTITSTFMYLLPVYGVLLAVAFLAEELHDYHLAGLIMVTLGVIMASAPLGLWRASWPFSGRS